MKTIYDYEILITSSFYLYVRLYYLCMNFEFVTEVFCKSYSYKDPRIYYISIQCSVNFFKSIFKKSDSAMNIIVDNYFWKVWGKILNLLIRLSAKGPIGMIFVKLSYMHFAVFFIFVNISSFF